MNTKYILSGYEDLEISSQIIIREAFARNLQVKVLDRKENFIQIIGQDKSEFIKEASKTSLDSYISFHLMENKTVSRYILKQAGLKIADGKSYDTIEEAFHDLPCYHNRKIVIKPTTTNFGIGIFIKNPEDSDEIGKEYIEKAFSYSSSIIIEDFIPGPEYRFLVIDFKVVAVCNRVPANVIGDGKHTISELIDIKNDDPRRGVGHITPLEKIQKTDIELAILQEQSFDFSTIPAQKQTVYLRKNSNISTGGDSIDVTDIVHTDFHAIAEKATVSVPARICGVDIIIEDLHKPADQTNYGILEINFNPVLYIHEFPYQGKERKVGSKILDLLGF